MTYLFTLSASVPPGVISTTTPLLIQTLGALAESISYLVSMYSLMHCCMAGGLDHLLFQSPLKPYLDGYSQVQPVNPLQNLSLLSTMSSLPRVMICYEDFGKSRRTQSMKSTYRLKKGLLCNTLRRHIAVLLMVDSSYHYLRSLMLHH